jgi:hypothetical protein
VGEEFVRRLCAEGGCSFFTYYPYFILEFQH